MIESVLEPLFHKTSTKKHWTFAEVGTNFEIHENNISFESLNYYLSICDSDMLVFGRCASARLTLEFLNINLALMNRNFDVEFTFEDEPEIPFVVGNFTVTEDKPSPDRKARSVTMYDALYFVLNTNYADWYNSISSNDWSHMTLGGFADLFFAHIGITVESASRAVLVNADMPVSKTLDTKQLLGSDILFAICQAAGCFGVMTNNNEFRFLYLKSEIEGLFPTNDLYPAEDLYPIEPVTTYIPNSEYYPPLIYETFMTPNITKLRIAESTEDVGTTIGSGDVGYEIIGNFLFAGKTAQQLSTYGANTLGAMTQRNYRPFSVEKLGNLCFEIGDPIRLGNEDIAVESYVLTRTFSGVQAFTDEISADGTQDYNTVANSASTSVQQLNSKTAILRQDVDGVSSTLTYELDDTSPGSYAYRTAQDIGLKVSSENLVSEMNSKFSSIEITPNGFNFQSTGSIRINTSNFTLDAQGNAYFSGTLASGISISAPAITGGSITGNAISGGSITGSTITGATVSGGTISGATISGGSLSIMDNNQTGEVYIDQNYIYVKDFRHSDTDTYVTALQYNQIRFSQGSSQRGLIDGGSYADAFEIKGGRSLFLNSDTDGYVSISGNTHIDMGAPYIDIWDSKIYVDSFKKMVWHSSLTGSEVNLKDDILDEIASIKSTLSNHESRITALENA